MAIVGFMGETQLTIGLTRENLNRLMDGDPFVQRLGQTVGFPLTLIIFYGETMDELKAIIQSKIGPDTVVIDKSKKEKHDG